MTFLEGIDQLCGELASPSERPGKAGGGVGVWQGHIGPRVRVGARGPFGGEAQSPCAPPSLGAKSEACSCAF